MFEMIEMVEMGIFCASVALAVALLIAALMQRRLMRAAIALAAASVMLSLVMYQLEMFWAAVFELSVCAGLITVVLISASSLTSRDEQDAAAAEPSAMGLVPLVAVGMGALAAAAVVVAGVLPEAGSLAVGGASQSFRDTLWLFRQADILGQLIAVLAGAFAVVILFKEGDKQ